MLAGLKGNAQVPLRTDLIINRALIVRGAFGVDAKGYADAIAIIESRRFPLEELHTHTFGLDDTALAIHTAGGDVPGEHAVHVSVHPRGVPVLVDAHTHLLPGVPGSPAVPRRFPPMEAVAGDSARTLLFGAMKFRARDVFFDAERRIAAQEAEGVDVEVLSPMPPLLRYALPAADGLSLARHVNEFAARPARPPGPPAHPRHGPDAGPGRRRGRAEGDPRPGPVRRGDRLQRAGPSIGDDRFRGSSPRPSGSTCRSSCTPCRAHRPAAAVDDGHLRRRVGGCCRGRVISGGMAEACPDLRISFSHAAGGLAMMLPRAQYFWGGTWNEEPPIPEKAIAHVGPAPLDLARRFYYDATVFDRRAVRYLVDLLGADRLLVGSDYPAMPREEPAAATVRSVELTPDQLEDITWRNAFRFLGIDPQKLFSSGEQHHIG